MLLCSVNVKLIMSCPLYLQLVSQIVTEEMQKKQGGGNVLADTSMYIAFVCGYLVLLSCVHTYVKYLLVLGFI